MAEQPTDGHERGGAASRKREKFEADDAESAEAKLVELVGQVVGLPLPASRPAALSPQQAAKRRADHASAMKLALAVTALSVAMVLVLEGPPGLGALLLPLAGDDTPARRSPQRAAYELAHEDVTRGLAGDEAALRRVSDVHGTSALPSLLCALRDAPEASTRRRAAHVLRVITSAKRATLMESDLVIVERAAAGDADAQVRADCAAARERLTVFGR